ncbi:MAG: YicC family protein [Burkholderiaceae bacterium]|nr:YicC family protein [Burkholderiaceae bacterium]
MTASMTAFGSGKVTLEIGTVSVEIRSVNSRFLDLQFRIPDELRLAEQPIRERLTRSIGRGKVEVRASFARAQSTGDQRLTESALQRVAQQLDAARKVLPQTESPRLFELLGWPDAQAAVVDPEVWAQACLQAFEPALAQLTEGRLREGERLAAAMLTTSGQMQEIVLEVESHMPALLATQRDKLAQKLRETVSSAFPGGFTHISGAELSERIASESSLFALRIDVAEELARLRSHIVELEFLLSGKKREGSGRGPGGKDPGSVGKRLDFLFQEMNREANTLGSKAASMDMTRSAMDLKLLIEQMREQAQNIE